MNTKDKGTENSGENKGTELEVAPFSQTNFNPSGSREVNGGGEPETEEDIDVSDSEENLSPEEQAQQDEYDAKLAGLAEGSEDGPDEEQSNALDTSTTKMEWFGGELELKQNPETTAALTEKGFDVKALDAEFYSEDGLTEETRTKLNEAFGKGVVDMYISGLDAKLESFKERQEVSAEKGMLALDSISGGKTKELFDWANKNLNAEEYEEIRTAINSGSKKLQSYAIKDLQEQSGIGSGSVQQEQQAEPKPQPIRGKQEKADPTGGGITKAEYYAAMANGEWNKDPSGWDKKREIGMNLGI